MKRINLRYDGGRYTLGDADLDELQGRILGVVTGDEPFWLTVNEGEGRFRPTDILITRYSQVAVSATDGDE